MTGARYDAEWDWAVARLREVRRQEIARARLEKKLLRAKREEIEVEILAVR